MKKRTYELFIEDIIDAINKIGNYTKKQDYETFIRNSMAVDAVLRNLEIIGEAAKKVPDDTKDKYGGIPWKRMVGLRNIVIHEYFGVDLENIWRIITKDIPAVKPAIVKILEEIKTKKD